MRILTYSFETVLHMDGFGNLVQIGRFEEPHDVF